MPACACRHGSLLTVAILLSCRATAAQESRPVASVACTSDFPSDYEHEDCLGWCDKNRTANCPRCKCRGCDVCAAAAMVPGANDSISQHALASHAMPTPPGPEVIGIAAIIGGLAGCMGGLVSWRHRKLLRHRPTLLSCFTAGVLIGISLLSVLPEAMDELVHKHSWKMSDVLLLFLASAGGLFVLEHVLFTHEHVSYGEGAVRSNTQQSGPAGGLASHDAAAIAHAEAGQSDTWRDSAEHAERGRVDGSVDGGGGGSGGDAMDSIEMMMACEPCEEGGGEDGAERAGSVPAPAQTQTLPLTPMHREVSNGKGGGGVRGVLGRARKWRSFLDDGLPCECCDEQRGGNDGGGDGDGVVSSSSGSDGATAAAGSAASLAASRLAASRREWEAVAGGGWEAVAGGAFQQLAWLIHAAIDGMVLSSVPSAQLLLPASFAVGVCALQDALAFCVLLARMQLGRWATCAALAVFSMAFPLGAALAFAVANAQADDDEPGQALPLIRVVIAAAFVYMASELAPPHTHRRLLNLVHGCAFALGVGVSGLAEAAERFVDAEGQ
jgi:zinc transporter ZupT